MCAKSKDLPGIKAPLKEWEKKGDLEYVNNVEVPAELVAEWFTQAQKKYSIKKIAIDSYRYALMNTKLKEIGFDAFEKKNIKLVRPSDIMRVSPIINSACRLKFMCQKTGIWNIIIILG